MRIRFAAVVIVAATVLALGRAASAQPVGNSAKAPASKPEVKPPESTKDLGNVPYNKVTVEYARIGDQRLMMGIYTPKQSKGPFPLVVWIYGGAWRNLWTNDRQSLPMANGAGLLVKNGYAVASPEHRLARHYKDGPPAWTFPAQIFDCKGAVRFLRANADKYSLDVQRVGAWGGSSGGHLVALLGTSGGVKELEGDVGGNLGFSSRVQAVVDGSGPTDLARLEETCQKLYGPAQSPPATLVGGPTAEHLDLVKMANPATYITKGCPPFLISHGDKDNLVPIEQSQFLVDALKKAGVDVTFDIVKGGGHGSGTTPAQLDEGNQKVLAFFDKHLKKATTQPAAEKAAN